LITQHQIIYWRGEATHPASAVAAFEQLLTDYLRVLGPEHPDTMYAGPLIELSEGET
jgi:hypothetical protein